MSENGGIQPSAAAGRSTMGCGMVLFRIQKTKAITKYPRARQADANGVAHVARSTGTLPGGGGEA